MKKCSMSKRVWIVLLAGFVLLTVQSMVCAAHPAAAVPPPPQAAAAATQAPKRLNDDCIKCHSKPPADIAAAGGKHKTEISCQDCHNGHPPATRKIIPLCSQCHEGKPHFPRAGSLGRHSNPHPPHKKKFGTNIPAACLPCHTGQIVKLRDNKS